MVYLGVKVLYYFEGLNSRKLVPFM